MALLLTWDLEEMAILKKKGGWIEAPSGLKDLGL